jgi:predicted S18 family serine protease
LREKKEKSIEAKITASKKQIEDKISYEKNLIQESETEIAELEREELEVIQRLQNTQLQQKNAFSELENILSSSRIRPKTPEKYSKKVHNSSGKKY